MSYNHEYYIRNKAKSAERSHDYWEKHKEAIRKRKHEHMQENREAYNHKTNQKNHALKLLVISKYGGKCACCGESHIEFLQVHHKNNNGKQHREQIGGSTMIGIRFYWWLKRNNFPNGYAILCGNCHDAISFYKYCPHQMKIFSREAS